MLQSFDGAFLAPGQLPSIESIEQELDSVIWQPLHRCVVGINRLIAGASRDAGNAPTTVLRPGLLLTKNAAGNFVPWGTVADLATDLIEGVMLYAQQMTRMGTNADRFCGYVMIGGFVKVNGLIIPGEQDSGIVGADEEDRIRQLMVPAFVFDDDPVGHKGKTYPAPE